MIQSKLPTGGNLPKSPYTLDDPASIEALLAALNVEPEQPQVEPEESEETWNHS